MQGKDMVKKRKETILRSLSGREGTNSKDEEESETKRDKSPQRGPYWNELG